MLASDTCIAIDSTEFTPIGELLVGDLIWVAMDVELSEWESRAVAFSSGTGNDEESSVVRVGFGDAAQPEFVIANGDQLFLMEDREFKPTSKLVAGADRLVRQNGNPAPVLDLTAGEFKNGLQAVATLRGTTGDPAGHLLVANGVVCGDYALELGDLDFPRREQR